MQDYPPQPGLTGAHVLRRALKYAIADVAKCRAKHLPTRRALERLRKVRTMALRYENRKENAT